MSFGFVEVVIATGVLFVGFAVFGFVRHVMTSE